MTLQHNTSTASHSRDRCGGRLAESFWMPSYCPRGLAEVDWRHRLAVLTDADEVHWDGGPHVTTHYTCACCGHRWSEHGWPVVMLFGLGSDYPEPPVRRVAGVDVARRTAGQVAQELWALRQRGAA
jgi:hypothetical protein